MKRLTLIFLMITAGCYANPGPPWNAPGHELNVKTEPHHSRSTQR